MKKINFKKTTCLSLAALALVAVLGVGSAMAYFTTYVTANGWKELDLGFVKTIPNETVVEDNKEITLTNTGDYDCYVRLKALTGEKYKDSLDYEEPDGNDNWQEGEDGYWYYMEADGTPIILPVDESTTLLTVKYAFDNEEPADFNVIIVQECTPVLYDNDGEPYADWNVKAVSQSFYNKEEAQ